MATTDFIRARAGTGSDAIEKPTASDDSDLSVIAQHMLMLMMRNIASSGFVIDDPVSGRPSRPGCVIAAPSFPRHTPGVDQDYVFNWVRDAAITALELAAAELPAPSVGGGQSLVDYVTFARLCQENLAAAIRATPDTSLTLGHACFTVDGQPRPWSEQSDGPALQTIAVLQAYGRLDDATRQVARDLVGVNLDYLLSVYRQPTTNLWEEFRGFSFFARSVQLRCFEEVARNTLGLPVPSGLADAIAWLRQELDRHWNGTRYVSILDPRPAPAEGPGYDPNIDIVSACLYGAVPPTDTRLLATAEALRRQWSDPGSPSFYPINGADAGRGLGPMLGRYPGDQYDGDTAHPVLGGHPWALCTCALAELYYRLAAGIDAGGPVPRDGLSAGFFDQVGVGAATPAAEAAEALRAAGDRMLRAVVFHADHLELSEQFDGTSGYEKSVTNLTWSYAAFLSAMRARTGRTVAG